MGLFCISWASVWCRNFSSCRNLRVHSSQVQVHSQKSHRTFCRSEKLKKRHSFWWPSHFHQTLIKFIKLSFKRKHPYSDCPDHLLSSFPSSTHQSLLSKPQKIEEKKKKKQGTTPKIKPKVFFPHELLCIKSQQQKAAGLVWHPRCAGSQLQMKGFILFSGNAVVSWGLREGGWCWKTFWFSSQLAELLGEQKCQRGAALHMRKIQGRSVRKLRLFPCSCWRSASKWTHQRLWIVHKLIKALLSIELICQAKV